MATTKRDRQRANRELRQAQAKKDQSRTQLMERTKRWSKIALLLVAGFIISNLVVNSCGDDTTSTTTTTLVETTLAP